MSGTRSSPSAWCTSAATSATTEGRPGRNKSHVQPVSSYFGNKDLSLCRFVHSGDKGLSLCRFVHSVEAFAEVTGKSSDQYISLSKSWQTRDTCDLKNFLVWLKQYSPFNQSDELNSLSSGIVADDKVNCDSVEELGENAVKGIVGKRFADVSLKRKVQTFTLAAMGNTKIIDKDPVVFNPNQLFHRIA
ncbi:hypothetical protein AVEN_140612-1 [Araneus ventricosus]|uniref:Uncharacterized protein n=1 Tax=Araneus ventricosus TaxID=182803 RepID=A0A4Y2V149_ARAVE|nr:hypothetical protein AVEN_140612-1 [Araneus ventricosus]